MKILIANHWLDHLGGSETFTYTICAELKRLGHDVHLFTLHKGYTSNLIKKDLGISIKLDDSYDLVLASHNTTIQKLEGYGKIIQTCHGTIPILEQVNKNLNS